PSSPGTIWMLADQGANDLEERKLALDTEIRRREIAGKESEVTRGGITAGQATIAGAVLALVSGALGATITAQSSQNIALENARTSLSIEKLKAKENFELEKSRQIATQALERSKFETSLIFEAIKTPSRSDAIRNLKFFVEAGFISDTDRKIQNLSDERLPSITPSPESAGRALQATGMVSSGSPASRTVCTGVAISPQHIITVSHCVGDPLDAPPPVFEFKIRGQRYPLELIKRNIGADLALLRIGLSNARLSSFLDRSHVRDPIAGERVYFALSGDEKDVSLRICYVASARDSDTTFEHNCSTGPGSAGAVIIAMADDALVGIHSSLQADGRGQAAKLSQSLENITRAHITDDQRVRP